jgi:hypothetical protein
MVGSEGVRTRIIFGLCRARPFHLRIEREEHIASRIHRENAELSTMLRDICGADNCDVCSRLRVVNSKKEAL